jgi:next-to-BRCA1 protein 1
MTPSAEQLHAEQVREERTGSPQLPPKYEPLQSEPLRPSYLQTVLAPSSHGNIRQPAMTPSIQSCSSVEAGQRQIIKDLHERAKARLEAEMKATKEKPFQPRDFTLPARPKQPSLMDTLFAPSFAIDCNNCGNAIANEHYHCSICDSGDFDLCQTCVDSGITCDGKDHWLIKRFQQGGSIIPSVTETIAPKKAKAEEPKAELKGEKSEVFKAGKYQGDRTCNSCINGKHLSTPLR